MQLYLYYQEAVVTVCEGSYKQKTPFSVVDTKHYRYQGWNGICLIVGFSIQVYFFVTGYSCNDWICTETEHVIMNALTEKYPHHKCDWETKMITDKKIITDNT